MLERVENDNAILEICKYVDEVAPTDKDALNIFYEILVAEGGAGCVCGSDKIVRKDGERSFICDDCGSRTWFLSRILLSKARRFKAYFAAALIYEAGLEITGSGLANFTNVVSATGLSIQKKLNTAISNQMPEDAPKISGRNLKAIIAKRTAITPIGKRPFAEQEQIDEMLALHADEQVVLAPAADDSSSIEQASAAENRLLDEFDMAHADSTRVDTELARSLALATANFVNTVIEYCHGIGRKAIQLKLAGWWCSSDRERWGVGNIMRLCLTHPPVTGREILTYVSPPLLSIMLC